MDQHWRPQSCGLAPTLVPYDFIGGVENLQADLTHILQRIFGAEVPIQDFMPHRTNSSRRMAEHYGPDEIRLVQEIYAADFAHLGYSPDPGVTARTPPAHRADPGPIRAWGRAWRLTEEGAFAEAVLELEALRDTLAGPLVDERLVRCRCALRGTAQRAALAQDLQRLEPALARGYGDWASWKWYGVGLRRIGRREDGLEAEIRAMRSSPARGQVPARLRRLRWRLAMLRAMKGRSTPALAAVPDSTPWQRGALRAVAAVAGWLRPAALASRSRPWHPWRGKSKVTGTGAGPSTRRAGRPIGDTMQDEPTAQAQTGAIDVFKPGALDGAILASRRLPYIYVQNWKCGCSTIKSTLWAAEHAHGTAVAPGHPHQRIADYPFVNDPGRWAGAAQEFVFTFVRNPFARLLSAYLNKIVQHRDPSVWGRFAARHGLDDAPLPFHRFLELVAATPPARMDMHWRPQSHTIAPHAVAYDFVGTMERFEEDLLQVLERIFGRDLPVHEHAPHRTGSTDLLASYYGPQEIDLARRICAVDFRELGYSRDPARQIREGCGSQPGGTRRCGPGARRGNCSPGRSS